MSEDDFEELLCPNCHGEGVVYDCWEEYACIDPESGCDLCERTCDWCHPKPSRNAVRKCRVCGCTDTQACMTQDGPCFWLEEDLCSGCLDKEDGE